MKKIFISLLAIAAIISCNKENTQNNTSIEHASRFPLLKVDNLETKTVLDGTQVKFKVGDCISVFNGIVSDSDHHGHCKYQCISIENGVASFEWMAGMDESKNPAVPFNEYEPSDDVDIIATYPNRSSSTSAFEPAVDGYGEGTVMIRMVASGSGSDEDTFAGSSLPIIAYAPQGEMLKFKHTCGLLKVTLKGTAAISKVDMNGNTNITGDASVAYAAEEPVLTIVGSQTKAKTITYSYNAPVQLTAEGRDLYFGLPVGTHDVTFTFTDTDGNNMVKTAKDLEIKRAVITPTELTYAADVKAITDLSANNSYANCYVIQAAGSYSFDAKKPNGEVVTGAKATWVWAAGEACSGKTSLPSTMMSEINYSGNKVSFEIPNDYAKGNVVVGLLNAENKLEYTWHIWLTEAGMQDVTVGDVVVMDRNLGATNVYDVTVATNAPLQGGKGNFYQWGRKDPILGARNSASSAEGTAFGTTNSQYCVINSEAGAGTAWAIGGTFGLTADVCSKNPLTMIANPSTCEGYDENVTSSWSELINANPCPYGYRVINQTEFESLVDGFTTDKYNNFGQVTLKGGVKLPRAGFRQGSDGKANNGGGTSSNSTVTSYARYYLNERGGKATQGLEYQFKWTNNTFVSGSNKIVTNTNAYNALNVRCVKVNN